jgi:hypothetical protein
LLCYGRVIHAIKDVYFSVTSTQIARLADQINRHEIRVTVSGIRRLLLASREEIMSDFGVGRPKETAEPQDLKVSSAADFWSQPPMAERQLAAAEGDPLAQTIAERVRAVANATTDNSRDAAMKTLMQSMCIGKVQLKGLETQIKDALKPDGLEFTIRDANALFPEGSIRVSKKVPGSDKPRLLFDLNLKECSMA